MMATATKIILGLVICMIFLILAINEENAANLRYELAEAVLLFPSVNPHVEKDNFGRSLCVVDIQTEYGMSKLQCATYRQALVAGLKK